MRILCSEGGSLKSGGSSPPLPPTGSASVTVLLSIYLHCAISSIIGMSLLLISIQQFTLLGSTKTMYSFSGNTSPSQLMNVSSITTQL